ncbi:MAG: ABC transporter permease [Chloroflexota bacterium]|nr:ABC transporter permease [Chloroflexota bacterium]
MATKAQRKQMAGDRQQAAGLLGARRRVAPALPRWVWPPVSLSLVLLLWAAVVWLGKYPEYLLPSPARVASRFVAAIGEGTWWRHTSVTLLESLLGFGLGFGVAVPLGWALARSRPLERALSPYLAASQSMPVIAIAPLVVLWFGYGLFPKVLICALVVFFPILVNTLVGIRNVPRELREVAQVFGANWWQMLRMVDLPLALPVLLGGVRLGLTLSITGAVVAEFIGADVGLGALLNISRGMFDTPLTFVALVTLMAIASLLYGAATAIDNRIER